MQLLSRFTPTLRLTVEFKLRGKTERGFVALFDDDDLLQDEDGDLLLIVLPSRPWTFPSPTAVCLTRADAGYEKLLETLQREKGSLAMPSGDTGGSV